MAESNLLSIPPVPIIPRLSDETSSSSRPTTPMVELSLSPPSPPRLSKFVPTPPYVKPQYLEHTEQTPTRRSMEATFGVSHSKSTSLARNATISVASAGVKASAPPLPQSFSLGRAATGVSAVPAGTPPRRNSLGDLKIPARISRAQDGLKKDLNRVREFAAHVEGQYHIWTCSFRRF